MNGQYTVLCSALLCSGGQNIEQPNLGHKRHLHWRVLEKSAGRHEQLGGTAVQWVEAVKIGQEKVGERHHNIVLARVSVAYVKIKCYTVWERPDQWAIYLIESSPRDVRNSWNNPRFPRLLPDCALGQLSSHFLGMRWLCAHPLYVCEFRFCRWIYRWVQQDNNFWDWRH